MPADWQLPPGVSRGLWEYLHDPAIARTYDEQLQDTPLLRFDQEFFLQHCAQPGRVIDLGSGTGRLAIALAQRGYWTLAVDLSEEMLKVAGDKAAQAEVTIHRLQANLVELGGLEDWTFDYAACLFSTLGLIEGVNHRRRFLAHVHRLLRPGGAFILHVHNKGFHAGTRHGRRMILRNWWHWLRRRERLGDFLMPPHQGVGPILMHLFSRREIVRELRRAGFTIVELRPVSTAADGRLRWPWWLPEVRAYGFLIAARRAV